MTEAFSEPPPPPKKAKRSIHIYSASEVARYKNMTRRELDGERLTYADCQDRRFFINWRKTVKGTMYHHRLVLEKKIKKEALKKYGSNISSNSSSNDHKRKKSIGSGASISEDKNTHQKRCTCTETSAKEDDFDAIMDDASSLSSDTLSDTDEDFHDRTTAAGSSCSSTRSASKHTQSVLPSVVLNIRPEELVFEKSIGEGQVANVVLAKYQNLPVACKFRRESKWRKEFESNVSRELAYSARLSTCRFMNPCIGVMQCRHQEIRSNLKGSRTIRSKKDMYLIQRYYENGDLRDYIGQRQGAHLHHLEVLQIGLSLFAGLSDAHKLNIGIVDLKLENILVDVVGSAWFTDFGSCIDFGDKQVIELDTTGVNWTKDVAAPEMLKYRQFSRESDVFMCAIILAEVMTPSLSDEEFVKDVLGREKDGSVAFNKKKIDPMYSGFMPLLEGALRNEPLHRPTADLIYGWLSKIRKLSMDYACKEITEEIIVE